MQSQKALHLTLQKELQKTMKFCESIKFFHSIFLFFKKNLYLVYLPSGSSTFTRCKPTNITNNNQIIKRSCSRIKSVRPWKLHTITARITFNKSIYIHIYIYIYIYMYNTNKSLTIYSQTIIRWVYPGICRTVRN